jgi:hypothetical protein
LSTETSILACGTKIPWSASLWDAQCLTYSKPEKEKENEKKKKRKGRK